MLEIDVNRFLFKTKTIWFSEAPFDIIGYDGVTFYACTQDTDMDGFSKEKFTTLIIDLNQNIDDIWKKMGKSSCRYEIRRAEKEGVEILVNKEYETFIEINKNFRMQKGLPEYNLDIDFLKKNGTLFVSVINGKIYGGQFYLNDDSHIRWLLGASRRLDPIESKNPLIGAANRLMIWEAIKYAKNFQIDIFDMGGYYIGNKIDLEKEKINFFKKSFGGNMTTQYIYRKAYSLKYTLAKKVIDGIRRYDNPR